MEPYIANVKHDLNSVVEQLDKWIVVHAPSSAEGITYKWATSWEKVHYFDGINHGYDYENDFASKVFWEYSRELALSGKVAQTIGLRDVLEHNEGDFGAWIVEVKLGDNPKVPQLYTSCCMTLIKPMGDEMLSKKIVKAFLDSLQTT